jgi:hypothetical protein
MRVSQPWYTSSEVLPVACSTFLGRSAELGPEDVAVPSYESLGKANSMKKTYGGPRIFDAAGRRRDAGS